MNFKGTMDIDGVATRTRVSAHRCNQGGLNTEKKQTYERCQSTLDKKNAHELSMSKYSNDHIILHR